MRGLAAYHYQSNSSVCGWEHRGYSCSRKSPTPWRVDYFGSIYDNQQMSVTFSFMNNLFLYFCKQTQISVSKPARPRLAKLFCSSQHETRFGEWTTTITSYCTNRTLPRHFVNGIAAPVVDLTPSVSSTKIRIFDEMCWNNPTEMPSGTFWQKTNALENMSVFASKEPSVLLFVFFGRWNTE